MLLDLDLYTLHVAHPRHMRKLVIWQDITVLHI